MILRFAESLVSSSLAFNIKLLKVDVTMPRIGCKSAAILLTGATVGAFLLALFVFSYIGSLKTKLM